MTCHRIISLLIAFSVSVSFNGIAGDLKGEKPQRDETVARPITKEDVVAPHERLRRSKEMIQLLADKLKKKASLMPRDLARDHEIEVDKIGLKILMDQTYDLLQTAKPSDLAQKDIEQAKVFLDKISADVKVLGKANDS